MNDPLTSVIITCFNGADCLAECLRSVTLQEASCEIIVVDDGSTDASLERCRILLPELPLDMLVVSQKNGGPARARNTGARLACGKYLGFLDVDDQYAPGFLNTLVQILQEEPSLVGACCQLELVELHRPIESWQREAMEATQPSNLLVRAEVFRHIGGFPEHQAFRGQTAGEDGAFRQQLTRQGKVAKLHRPLCRHRVRPGSHLDFFLDRSTLDNGKIRFKQLAAEEQDGSLQSALRDYRRSVQQHALARISAEVQNVTAANLTLCQLAERFGKIEGRLEPAEGFALYQLARAWPIAGATVETDSFQGGATCWLALGCQEGRHPRVAVHFRRLPQSHVNGGSAEPAEAAFRRNLTPQLLDHVVIRKGSSLDSAAHWSDPVRLLLLSAEPFARGIRKEFAAWSGFVVEGGLVVFQGVGVQAEVTNFLAELRQAPGPWREVLRCGSLAVLQRLGPQTNGVARPELAKGVAGIASEPRP